MRIVCKNSTNDKNSRFQQLSLSSTTCYNPTDVEEMLQKHCLGDGRVNTLFVDFSGEYIPVVNIDEVRLLSALACAYHNSCVRNNIQVSAR